MKLTPFIILDGSAEDALKYYAETLGGKISWMGRYADCLPETPESHKQRIIHSELEFAGNKLCICDADYGTTSDLGKNGYSLNLTFDTVEQARAIYDKMSEGADIRCEFGATFFAKAYAELTDKFGVSWNILVA